MVSEPSPGRRVSECEYLLDVVVRDEADGLVAIAGAGLLLRLPPSIVRLVFEDVEEVAIGNGKLALGLRLIVV